MTSFVRRILMLCTLPMALASCGITGGQLIREGEPVGTLIVENDSSQTLTQILISQCGAVSYGLNRMSSGEMVDPGWERAFTVSQGCYDVMAGYGWGTGYATASGKVQVSAGQTIRWAVTD